jgi:hypothetical protein
MADVESAGALNASPLDGDGAMQEFCRVAFYETVWRASLGMVATVILMVCFRAEPTIAFLIGGHVALLFVATMIVHAAVLANGNIELSEPWLSLDPGERPVGAPERQWAQRYLIELMIRFARGGAALAIALAGLALLMRA